jgi:hypothetical protein
MPIMLHALDGSVKEVGSTQLLRECVRELRTEQAILDGSANLMVLEEIAGSLGGLALPAASDRSFNGKNGKNGGDDEPAGIPDASFVDGAAATHATPAALAEAAAARAAKLGKKTKNASSPETETESDFSPDGDVTVLQATDEATDETGLVSGDLDIASSEPGRKGGVEADAGPR